MLFKTIFTTVAIAGSAMAGFDIRTGITAIYPSDAAEVSLQLATRKLKKSTYWLSLHPLPMLCQKPSIATMPSYRHRLISRVQWAPSTHMHEHVMVSQKLSPQQGQNTRVTPLFLTGKLIQPTTHLFPAANHNYRYTAMPADALKVFESIRKQEDKILESVIPKAARTSGSQGAAPQATGMGLYTHGAIAAVVGVVAAAL